MYLNKNDIKKFIYFYRIINKINNIIDIFINTFKFRFGNVSELTNFIVRYGQVLCFSPILGQKALTL